MTTGREEVKGEVRKLLDEWGVTAGGFQSKLETSTQRLSELQTQMRSLQATPTTEEPDIFQKIVAVAKPLLFDWGPLFPSGIRGQQAKKILKAEIDIEASNATRFEFYSRLYTVIPIGIMGEEIDSVDEALAIVAPPSSITGAELVEVNSIVQGMLAGIGQQVSEGDIVEPISEQPPLVKPVQIITEPTGIHQLTVNAIVKQLTTPSLPDPTLSDPEWDELLAKTHPEYADMSQVEIVRAEAQRIIAESRLLNAKVAGFQAAIS